MLEGRHVASILVILPEELGTRTGSVKDHTAGARCVYQGGKWRSQVTEMMRHT